jgi:hypothetical protein
MVLDERIITSLILWPSSLETHVLLHNKKFLFIDIKLRPVREPRVVT